MCVTASLETLPPCCISYIRYPVWFQDDQENIQALIDFKSEINTMISAYAMKLYLIYYKTKIGDQKIDGSILKIHGMVIVYFLVKDKLRKIWFFEENFLLADISMRMILEMLFLTFFDANIWFSKKKLTWRSYIAIEALPIIKKIKLIDKGEFATTTLDENSEIFVMHIAALEISPKITKMTIHFFQLA